MIGKTVSHYRVLELLGAGGMGVVYKAEDVKLSRLVALKFLPAHRAGDQQASDRFLREARAASAFNHPNICTIYEVDEFEGSQFIAMELLEGHTLEQQVDGRPLALGSAAGPRDSDCGRAGRGALPRHRPPRHQAGQHLRHDARPGQDPRFRVGEARRCRARAESLGLSIDATRIGSRGLTTKGVTLGTVAYMSPEQARGENLDGRTDLFSFGVVLYEMATGQRTFLGNTSAVIFDAILNREPRAPMELNPEIPPELERIIAKALEKDRQLRYQTAADLRADLQRVKRERESGQRQFAAAHRRWRRRGAGRVGHRRVQRVVPCRLWFRPPRPRRLRSRPTCAVAGRWSAPPSALLRPLSRRSCCFRRGHELRRRRLSPNRSLNSRRPRGPVGPAGPAVPAAPPGAEPSRPPSAPPSVPSSPAAASSGSAAPPRSPAQPPASPAPPGAVTIVPPPSQADASRAAQVRGKKADPGSEELRVARAKLDAGLYDQALADLKGIVARNPTSPTAPEAYLLIAKAYERQNRLDDAAAAYVELRTKYQSSPAAAEGTFAMAEFVLRSKRSDREQEARGLFDEIPTRLPDSPWAPRALARKATLEDRAKLRVVDPQLNTSVPAALVSYRTLVERYPSAETTEASLAKLADMYEDLKRFDLAARSLDDLGERFPTGSHDAAWRAAELYDKKIKDMNSARSAYARVPTTSSHYKEAQKRAQR